MTIKFDLNQQERMFLKSFKKNSSAVGRLNQSRVPKRYRVHAKRFLKLGLIQEYKGGLHEGNYYEPTVMGKNMMVNFRAGSRDSTFVVFR